MELPTTVSVPYPIRVFPIPDCMGIIMSDPGPVLFEQTKAGEKGEAKEPKILYLAISSDGGLCGGIHSQITRYMKKAQAAEPGTLAVVGDKPKAQLSRAMPKALSLSFNGIGKDVPTFVEASAIADEIMKNGGDFDEVSRCRLGIGICFHSV